ncbi:MAG TPA: ring-cleaving dioxygenase [Opitutaceae bacterium]|nr:ring-cleaving dioxygenase [Opitutaceae bacterium]
MKLLGIHHVTAIASDPRQNVAFYTEVLGLKLVKKTVNFDDPSTYHLYYGDSVGTPGSILTFFPWAGLRRGRVGLGQASATAFSISAGSLDFWQARLTAKGVSVGKPFARFNEQVLAFTDRDGLGLELVAHSEPDNRPAATHPEIPAAHAIRGFHGVTLAIDSAQRTAPLLTSLMGYRELAREGLRTRYTVANGGPGTYVDILVDTSLPRGLQGAGTVHHVAFRTPDDAAQAADRAALNQEGFHVSPVMDRNYFHSIYYREPEGILFEIATDPPGFLIDETVETLGTHLKLPAQYETRRAEIESALPKLNP